jgi:hypothetical protein
LSLLPDARQRIDVSYVYESDGITRTGTTIRT